MVAPGVGLDGKELEARESLAKGIPEVRLVHRQTTMVAVVVELAERLIVRELAVQELRTQFPALLPITAVVVQLELITTYAWQEV
jgi:hypothetical protein